MTITKMIDAMIQQQMQHYMGWLVLCIRSKMDFKPNDTYDTLKCKTFSMINIRMIKPSHNHS